MRCDSLACDSEERICAKVIEMECHPTDPFFLFYILLHAASKETAADWSERKKRLSVIIQRYLSSPGFSHNFRKHPTYENYFICT